MKSILLRMGELFLKGENRGMFENVLVSNIRKKLEGLNYKLQRTRGRIMIAEFDEENEIVERLTKVFGLVSLSVAEEVDASPTAISQYVSTIKLSNKTFKVDVNRADKRFPISSMDFAAELGGEILENNPNAIVELYHPEIVIHVDIRNNGKAYIFDKSIKCQGGLPLSTRWY